MASQHFEVTYDTLGRQKSVTDADGHTTQYTYDLLGRQTTVADASGNVTREVYDALGRLIEEINPLR